MSSSPLPQPPYCNCVYNIKDKVWDVQIYFIKFFIRILIKLFLPLIYANTKTTNY